MNFIPTTISGCFKIEPNVILDDRCYFMKSLNEKTFKNGIRQNVHFIQQNQSFSKKRVLRGLHYQTGNHAQAKLVCVLSGKVLDIALDIRSESATFGQHVSALLSDKNQRLFLMSKGFAYGFLVISETATFFYKCDNFYNK